MWWYHWSSSPYGASAQKEARKERRFGNPAVVISVSLGLRGRNEPLAGLYGPPKGCVYYKRICPKMHEDASLAAGLYLSHYFFLYRTDAIPEVMSWEVDQSILFKLGNFGSNFGLDFIGLLVNFCSKILGLKVWLQNVGSQSNM